MKIRVRIRATLHLIEENLLKKEQLLLLVPSNGYISTFIEEIRKIFISLDLKTVKILNESLSLEEFIIPITQVSNINI